MLRYLVPIALLIACKGDGTGSDSGPTTSLGVPEITTDPADSATSTEDVEVVILTDAEGGDGTYVISWLSAEGVSWTESTLAATATTKGETWTATVQANGPGGPGPGASASVEIVNSPPSLTDAHFDPSVPTIGTPLVCVPDGASDPDDDTVTFTYAWTVGGSAVSETTDTLAGTAFSSGDSIACTITPSDGEDSGDPVSVTGAATNSPPVGTTATIQPSAPASTDDLTCVAGAGTDPDGDTVTFTYAWTVDGTVVAGETTDTLAESHFIRDQSVVCTAIPFDGAANGVGIDSAAVVPSNGIPELTDIVINPNPPLASDVIVCTPTVSDPDGDALTLYYTWRVAGVILSEGEGADFLSPPGFAYGEDIFCEVSATDGTDTVSLISSPTFVGNSPPSVSDVSLSPTPSNALDPLLCQYGGTDDIDGHTVTVRYSWSVNGTVLTSETSDTLSAGSAVSGDEVICTITPNDGLEDGVPRSASQTLENAPPNAETIEITPSPAYATTALTCDATATDPDSDTVGFTYTWTVNSNAAGTGSTLAAGTAVQGDSVQCTATPNDGTEDGDAISTTVILLNTPPEITAPGLVATPSPAREGSSFTCAVGTTSDADGDNVSVDIRWTVGGTTVSGQTGPSLSDSYFAKGDAVVCWTTPSDASAAGTEQQSNSITVENSVPTMLAPSLSPSTATVSSSYTCAPGATNDADPTDTVNVEYRWTRNSTTVNGQTGSTVAAGVFLRGEAVQCHTTPTDGDDSGSEESSNSVTVQNTAPTLASASLSPTTAYETSTLTCTGGATADADGNTVSLAYRWTVNGSTIGASSSTLTGSSFSRGQTVACHITPNDGTDDGIEQSSNTVTIRNTLPVITAPSLGPSPAYEATSLSCAAGTTSDVDNDSVSVIYRWTRGSSTISGATSSGLTGANFNRGDNIACHTTPRDTESGIETSSNAITIQNTAPALAAVNLSPGSATTTTTLSCSPSGPSDADNDTVGYDYRWTRGGSTISGQTASTLASSQTASGQQIRCFVTPRDQGTSGSEVGSNTVTIQNTLPTVGAPTLAPTTAYETDTLTCTAGSTADADGETVNLAYRWTVAGSTVGVTTNTITGANFNRDQAVRCYVTPNDGNGDGTEQGSNTVTIRNSTPTGPNPTLSPTTAYETSTLSCAAGSGSDDDPGDSVSFTYRWTRGGSTLSGRTGSTLTNGYFAKGQSIRCFTRPTDGTASGTEKGSNTVTIQNTIPGTFSASVTPTSPQAQADDLLCSGTTSDVDGDTITYTAEWQWQNYAGTTATWSQGVENSGTSNRVNDAVNAGDIIAGRTYRCRLTASDGPGNRTTSWSGWRTVGSPPGCPGVYDGNNQVAGPYAAYGTCWYVAPPGDTCDATCGDLGVANVNGEERSSWADNCSAPGNDDVGTWFRTHGNPTNSSGTWSYGGSGMGYLIQNSYQTGKCLTTVPSGVGSFPGDNPPSSSVAPVCACGTSVAAWRRATTATATTFFSSGNYKGIVVRPSVEEWAFEVGADMSFPSTACTADWYIHENTGNDLDGPWTLKDRGQVNVTATGVRRYTSGPTTVRMLSSRTYAITWASTCTVQHQYGAPASMSPLNQLGLCFASSYGGYSGSFNPGSCAANPSTYDIHAKTY
ncbi:MAG: hypothetical protein KC912_23010 [Proteobacteria bacterium]|nr:hypothetical protein [Pseudomonadota bacterium]